jgi:hypothetical protein
MRVDLRVVAAFAVLAGAAAAQQSAQHPADKQPVPVAPAAASDRDDGNAVEGFLDWLKRHADEPKQEPEDDWGRRGGRDGGGNSGGGGDGGGSGGHGG